MTCHLIQESILESLDSPLPSERRTALELHMLDCEQCKHFQQAQLALDQALAEHYVTPPLSASFRVGLKRKVKADRGRTYWDSLWASMPDIIHIGGGLVMTAGCAWLLPVSTSLSLAAGVAFTLGSYVLQTLVRFGLEEMEGL
jgi:hypothetical protein